MLHRPLVLCAGVRPAVVCSSSAPPPLPPPAALPAPAAASGGGKGGGVGVVVGGTPPETLKSKVQRIQYELSIDSGLGIAAALKQANGYMGLNTAASATPQQQAEALLRELGI